MNRAISILLAVSLLHASLSAAQEKRDQRSAVALKDSAEQALAELRKLERAGAALTYDFVFTIATWQQRWYVTASLAASEPDALVNLAEGYAKDAARLDAIMYTRIVQDVSQPQTAMTRYFMLDAQRLLAEARRQPMADAPALLLAAESAYRRLDENRARWNHLNLSVIHALCFFSTKWLQTELAIAPNDPQRTSTAVNAHLDRMRALSEIVMKDKKGHRVQRTLVRYFLEDAHARAERTRSGDAAMHVDRMIAAITEHQDALHARERAGDPLTPEFVEFIHAASLRRMTAPWLARPQREERLAASHLHRKTMTVLRNRLHSMPDAPAHARAASDYYVLNAERILEDVSAFGSSYVDFLVE